MREKVREKEKKKWEKAKRREQGGGEQERKVKKKKEENKKEKEKKTKKRKNEKSWKVKKNNEGVSTVGYAEKRPDYRTSSVFQNVTWGLLGLFDLLYYRFPKQHPLPPNKEEEEYEELFSPLLSIANRITTHMFPQGCPKNGWNSRHVMTRRRCGADE